MISKVMFNSIGSSAFRNMPNLSTTKWKGNKYWEDVSAKSLCTYFCLTESEQFSKNFFMHRKNILDVFSYQKDVTEAI